MPNLFNKPTPAQFIDTYIPLPFEAMIAAGAAKQQRFDERATGLTEAVAATQMVPAIPDTLDERYVQYAGDKMQEIAQKYYSTDLTDPVVNIEMQTEINNAIDKNRLRRIQESRAMWDSAQEHKRKLMAEGKYHEALDLDPISPTFDSRTGVYNYLAPALENIREVGEQYFDDIDPSTIKQSGNFLEEGIDPDIIKEVARQNVYKFQDTNAGQQAMRIAADRKGWNYNALSEDEKDSLAYQTLIDIGKERIHSKLRALPKYMTSSSDDDDKSGIPPFIMGEGVPNPNFLQINGMGKKGRIKYKFDEAGNNVVLKDYSDISTYNLSSYIAGLAPNYPQSELDSDSTIDKKDLVKAQLEANRVMREDLNKILDRFPNLRALDNPKKIFDAYAEMAKDAKTVGYPKHLIPNEQARSAIGKALGSSLGGRRLKIADAKGVAGVDSDEFYQADENNDLFKKMGYTSVSFGEALRNGDIQIEGLSLPGTVSGEDAGSILLQVPDKKGRGKNEPRTIQMYFNDESSEIAGKTSRIYTAINSGEEYHELVDDASAPIRLEDGSYGWRGIKVVPKAYQGADGKWKYDYDLIMTIQKPDGSIIETNRRRSLNNFDLRDLNNVILKNLQESDAFFRYVDLLGEGKLGVD